jgi:hypothetical protein
MILTVISLVDAEAPGEAGKVAHSGSLFQFISSKSIAKDVVEHTNEELWDLRDQVQLRISVPTITKGNRDAAHLEPAVVAFEYHFKQHGVGVLYRINPIPCIFS